MRLFEVATVEKQSALSMARKINNLVKCENLSVLEYKWLCQKAEDEYLKHVIRKQGEYFSSSCNSYDLENVDTQILTDASDLATALTTLNQLEKALHLKAQTKIKQTTDSYLNSEELKAVALNQAYAELQTAYNDQIASTQQHVSTLANMATDI